jgi:hypothetical protein
MKKWRSGQVLKLVRLALASFKPNSNVTNNVDASQWGDAKIGASFLSHSATDNTFRGGKAPRDDSQEKQESYF